MVPEQDLAEDARHAAKMAKKKAARDRMMAEKSGEKGLIIVHTGAGKGKSSSAFGMIVRWRTKLLIDFRKLTSECAPETAR